MSQFDPYSQWLGIPPEEQPPDHYRLLGIPTFESNPETIRNATDLRMAAIRVYQTGPRSAYTQKLLNEFAAAKLCLLNDYAKSEYDATLADRSASLADPRLPTAVPETPPPPSTSFAPLPLAVPEPAPLPVIHSASDARGGFAWSAPLIGFMLVVGLAGVGWGMKQWLDRPSASPHHVLEPEPVVPDPAIAAVPLPASEDSDLVVQEASGFLVLPMERATRSGSVQLTQHSAGTLLTGWKTSDDAASWRFRLTKLPSQGIFRLRISYQAAPEAEGAVCVLLIDGTEHLHDLRARGRLLEDELYLAVPGGGLHTLTLSVRDKPADAVFGLKMIEFSTPR